LSKQRASYFFIRKTLNCSLKAFNNHTNIADCQLPIADFALLRSSEKIGNWQLAIGNSGV